MIYFLAIQLNKFWLHTESFKPDSGTKYRVMDNLGGLLTDYFSFIFGLEENFNLPSFYEVFSLTDFYDYLKLVKKELKIILKEIHTTEQLTGLFTGLLGHGMSFNQSKSDLINLSNDQKEYLMLHSLKLLDLAYLEQFHEHIPLPDDYRDWLDSMSYDWEDFVKDLD